MNPYRFGSKGILTVKELKDFISKCTDDDREVHVVVGDNDLTARCESVEAVFMDEEGLTYHYDEEDGFGEVPEDAKFVLLIRPDASVFW